MALWQFDFYIVPRGKCVIVDGLENEDILSWKQDDISLIEIDFLEKETSWIRKIYIYCFR